MCCSKYTFSRLMDKNRNVKISKMGTNILFMVTTVTKGSINFATLKIIQEWQTKFSEDVGGRLEAVGREKSALMFRRGKSSFA